MLQEIVTNAPVAPPISEETVGTLITVVVPLVALLVMTALEGWAERRSTRRERVAKLGWDLVVLAMGILGGAIEIALRGRTLNISPMLLVSVVLIVALGMVGAAAFIGRCRESLSEARKRDEDAHMKENWSAEHRAVSRGRRKSDAGKTDQPDAEKDKTVGVPPPQGDPYWSASEWRARAKAYGSLGLGGAAVMVPGIVRDWLHRF